MLPCMMRRKPSFTEVSQSAITRIGECVVFWRLPLCDCFLSKPVCCFCFEGLSEKFLFNQSFFKKLIDSVSKRIFNNRYVFDEIIRKEIVLSPVVDASLFELG